MAREGGESGVGSGTGDCGVGANKTHVYVATVVERASARWHGGVVHDVVNKESDRKFVVVCLCPHCSE